MKKLLSISIVILILTGCNNVDDILSNYNNILSQNNEQTEQTKDDKIRDVINYCDVLYGNKEGKPPQIHSRNIYEVFINYHDQILAENKVMEISNLKTNVKRFINNNGVDPNSSDNPLKAIFLIHSEGHSDQDDKIIELINSAYNSLNIPINERKICHMRGSILEEWRRMHSPPPPPPPPEVIEIVEDDVEIEDTESDEDVEIEIEEDDDEFYMVVENMPEFPGGDIGLMKYIQKNVNYPAIAKEYNITGKVYVSFIVDKKGSVTNVKIVRGVDKNLDAEAMRVVKSLPKYKPGLQRGELVRVMFTIPINFKLN